ncbi:MAG: hypothetical protein RQ715_09565 [Methylococcales bacterium]|nr:hypothetical protein [Methylococcales bacterium]
MPLQDLVEYFNDRLEWEHHANFRPFFFKDNQVYGLFGPIRIGTDFQAITPLDGSEPIGQWARLQVSTEEVPDLQNHELEALLSLPASQAIHPDSIVDFDRLARTVHMLNFLTLPQPAGVLQLDVDPRHVLGVKRDHGAYFQEVIIKCGLQPSAIAIHLKLSSIYARYYKHLLQGLENYRQRGYQVALQTPALTPSLTALIDTLQPDRVSLPLSVGALKQHAALNNIPAVAIGVDDLDAMRDARLQGFQWVTGTLKATNALLKEAS